MITTLSNNVFQMQEMVIPIYIAAIAIFILIPIVFFATCSWLKKKTETNFPKIKTLITVFEFVITFIVVAFLMCQTQNYDPNFECLSSKIAVGVIWDSPFMTVIKVLVFLLVLYLLLPGTKSKKKR